jgi:hypothetical protein
MRVLFVILLAGLGVGVGCGGGRQLARSPDMKPTADTVRSRSAGPGTSKHRDARLARRGEHGDRRHGGAGGVLVDSRGKRTHAKRVATAERRELPTHCVQQGEFCVPPHSFVRRLCQGKYPDVALYMMKNDQPWTRRFVRVEQAHAVNAVSGRQGESKLLFGEEVLVLRYRTGGAHGDMRVSGMEGYEVLRWDGSCATLAEGELIAWMPPKQIRHSVLSWRALGKAYRRALLQDERIAAAERMHRDECHGARLGRSSSCQKAVESLNGAIEAAVHNGMALPIPAEIP